MKLFLSFYLGLSIGICLVDYLTVKGNSYLCIYKHSPLPIIPTLVLSPILLPILLVIYVVSVIKDLRG